MFLPDAPARARTLMLDHTARVRARLGDRPRDAVGAVLVLPDVDPDRLALARELVPGLEELPTGVCVAVVSIADVQELAVHLDPEAARALATPPKSGYVRVLLVLPGAVSTAAVTWVDPATPHDPALPSPPTMTAAFFERWPSTAHLARRLTSVRGRDGRTRFDVAQLVDLLGEFLRIVDAMDIAPVDLRDAAARVREALPELEAQRAPRGPWVRA